MQVQQDDSRNCPACHSTRSHAISPALQDKTNEGDVSKRRLVQQKRIRLPGIHFSLLFGKSFQITFVIALIVSIVLVCLFRKDTHLKDMEIQIYVINPSICAFCCGFLVNLVVVLGRTLYASIRPNPAEALAADNRSAAELLNRDRFDQRDTEISDLKIQTDDKPHSPDSQP